MVVVVAPGWLGSVDKQLLISESLLCPVEPRNSLYTERRIRGSWKLWGGGLETIWRYTFFWTMRRYLGPGTIR